MGADENLDGQLMLLIIPAHQVDYAWKDGADKLGESCEVECTPDQLKLLLSRGERVLVRMDTDGVAVGWGAYKTDQLANMRVLFITNLVAHNAHFERFFEELKDMAKNLGCSRIRCAAKPAQERLYRLKCDFKPVYQVMEVVL